MFKKYLKQLSLPESYISITLGFLVVLVAGLLAYNYFSKNRPGQPGAKEGVSQNQTSQEKMELPTTHTVVEGETLWSIAEKFYNSGYNWVTIAKENKLENANSIEAGQVLSLPKAEIIRVGENISAAATELPKSYTVVAGDYLWKIALAQYGDGYAWVKIANANHLANPNLIHPGNVLTLPR